MSGSEVEPLVSEGLRFRPMDGKMWAYVQKPGPEAMIPPEGSDDEDYEYSYSSRVRQAFGVWRPVPWVWPNRVVVDLTDDN